MRSVTVVPGGVLLPFCSRFEKLQGANDTVTDHNKQPVDNTNEIYKIYMLVSLIFKSKHMNGEICGVPISVSCIV